MRDEKEIREIKEGLSIQFSGLQSQYNAVKAYYDQKMSIGKLPKDVEVYKPATAREQVDAAVDHIMGLGQKIVVPPWSESEESQKIRQKLQTFGNYFLKLLDKIHRNVRRNCTKHGILYGMFCLKGPLYDARLGPVTTEFPTPEGYESAVKDFEKYCERTFPFVFRPVHPSNVIFDLSPKPEFVIESFSRKAIQIASQYPEWKIGSRGKFEDVSWWEFWDNETMAYFVDDDLLLVRDNPYKFMPYEIGIAGFGEEASTATPEDLIVSMIAPALSAYKMESRLMTVMQAHLEYDALGRWMVEHTPGADFDLKSSPGDVSVIPASYKLHNEQPAAVSKDAYAFLQMLKGDIEKVMPQVVQGVYPKGVTSGYMGGLSVGQARLKLEQLIASWEYAVGSVLDKVIFFVKNIIPEPVGILGNIAEGSDVITLKPAELQPDKMHFYCVLDADTPEERDRRIMLGESLQDRRGLSLRTIIEKYYGENPEYELDQMLIEDAMKDPNLRMQIAMSVMKEVGMDEVLKLIQSGQMPGGAPVQGQPSSNPMQSPQTSVGEGQRTKMRLGGSGEMRSAPEMEGFGEENQ